MRVSWAPVRTLIGTAVLVAVVARLGTGPFLSGLAMIDGWSVLAAVGIAALTTVCCAWRWSVIARGLGIQLGLGEAVAACYRSQLLNSTLPGGVLGDVHRGLRHGRAEGDVGTGLRAVAWDRSSGQVVQFGLTAAVLLMMPSPLRVHLHLALGQLTALVLGGAVAGLTTVAWVAAMRRRPGGRSSPTARPARILRRVRGDLRDGVLSPRAWPAVLTASVVVVAGHVATLFVAAATAGSTATPASLLPLAVVVLLAMSVPVNVAGWGPREGAAAWVFGLAGLGAAQGVSVAAVYGVLALVANLPGAVVLGVLWWRSRDRLVGEYVGG
jgi:uncharacterized membrane protein YbhN (UPF0104 family)